MPRGRVVVVRDPGEKSSRILLVSQRGKPRSKYLDLVCFCPRSRRRKDGSCKTTRLFLEQHLRPELRGRIRVVHDDRAEKSGPRLEEGR